MERSTRLLLVVPVTLLLLAVGGMSAGSDPVIVGLKGSKHDFSGESWTNGDMCIACHAESSADLPEAPLWGPSAKFNRAFGDAVSAAPGESRRLPGAGSLVCMRCHDGTMASDMFGGLAAPAAQNKRHPAFMSTGHGSTNHPVGMDYPQFDPGFRPMNAILSEGKVPLPAGRVECVSCHDPHNQAGAPNMLSKSNARSALCLTCHKK